jgi:hypothetical protein
MINKCKMSIKIFSFDEFLIEGYPSADIYNTPGMGNVTSTTTTDARDAGHADSGDQDGTGKHLKMHERGHHDDSWMRPSGDYKNRNWLVPNYEMYQNQRQSNARFQIGQEIRCVSPGKDCYGMSGKIVAFEDNTIRWECKNSETGVGQTAKQYRSLAEELEPVI